MFGHIGKCTIASAVMVYPASQVSMASVASVRRNSIGCKEDILTGSPTIRVRKVTSVDGNEQK